MVGHPWHYRGMLDQIDGNLRGLLLDVPTWAREGLIDSAVAAGYYRDGGTPTKAFACTEEETAASSTSGPTPGSRKRREFTRDFDPRARLGANKSSSGKPTTSTTAPTPKL